MESFIVSTFEVQLAADIALMESQPICPICAVPKSDLPWKHAAFHTARVLVISLTSGPEGGGTEHYPLTMSLWICHEQPSRVVWAV